jgi:hypothetical protein
VINYQSIDHRISRLEAGQHVDEDRVKQAVKKPAVTCHSGKGGQPVQREDRYSLKKVTKSDYNTVANLETFEYIPLSLCGEIQREVVTKEWDSYRG